MRFVLINGGFHGAWCWERLIPELEARGHQAVAVELPGHGTRAHEEASLAGYRDAVVELIEPGDVLVPHSMGGFIATVAADAAIDRVRHIVYLAAGLPLEGLPMTSAGAGDISTHASMVAPTEDRRAMRFVSDEAAINFFFHDCAPELAQWACSKLTPQPLGPMLEPISVPRFWQAQPPRSLILCRQDRAGGGEAKVARSITRFGVEPLWMDSSHSPFLSQPAECAERVIEAATRPPIGPLLPN
ncbi:alpha/beta hydrolase [Phenylobacterium sp. LjRoot225]|uniref:alpha/beta hydrolase n=1 Tax=Phenylobacterium sp. LjRoot225 TaxID=3342285 RepID=UPI003ECC50B6